MEESKQPPSSMDDKYGTASAQISTDALTRTARVAQSSPFVGSTEDQGDEKSFDLNNSDGEGTWAWLNDSQCDEEVLSGLSAKKPLPPEDRPWTCSACTFVNKNPLHLACAVCGTSKEMEPASLDDIEKEFPGEKVEGDTDTIRRDAAVPVNVDCPEIIEDDEAPLPPSLQDLNKGNSVKIADVIGQEQAMDDNLSNQASLAQQGKVIGGTLGRDAVVPVNDDCAEIMEHEAHLPPALQDLDEEDPLKTADLTDQEQAIDDNLRSQATSSLAQQGISREAMHPSRTQRGLARFRSRRNQAQVSVGPTEQAAQSNMLPAMLPATNNQDILNSSALRVPVATPVEDQIYDAEMVQRRTPRWKALLGFVLFCIVFTVMAVTIGVVLGLRSRDDNESAVLVPVAHTTSATPSTQPSQTLTAPSTTPSYPAWGQVGQTILGEAVGDSAGYSVAISGDGKTLAIGAPWNDSNGRDSGQVRVYHRENDNLHWIQRGQTFVGDAADDRAGISVDLSADGNTLAFSATWNSRKLWTSGQVKVFEWSDDSLQWKILGSPIYGGSKNDQIGTSISLSADGMTLAIGAQYSDRHGSNSGYAMVYHRTSEDSGWKIKGQTFSGDVAGDQMGNSVSISSDGNILAIGAHFLDVAGFGENSGQVKVYRWNDDGLSWTQLGQSISGKARADMTGKSVALSANGNVLAVGSSGNDANGFDSGEVRVYVWNNEGDGDEPDWKQRGNVIVGDAPKDQLGRSVSLSSNGNILAIGAPWSNAPLEDSGQVMIFEWDEAIMDYMKVAQDIVGDSTSDSIGYSLALSWEGDTLAIGSDQGKDSGVGSGLVKVFNADYESTGVALISTRPSQFPSPTQSVSPATMTAQSEVWEQVGRSINGEAAGDISGYSVAISGDGKTLAIGAIWHNGNGDDSGQVRVYHKDASDPDWIQRGQTFLGDAAGDRAGMAVTLSSDGNTLALSATWNDGNGRSSGQVKVFGWSKDDLRWKQLGESIYGASAYDHQGDPISLAADGMTMAVGAEWSNSHGIDSGRAIVYHRTSKGSDWLIKGQTFYGDVAGDRMGHSISISADGNIVAIGAPYHDLASIGKDAGQVKVYSWDDDGLSWKPLGRSINGEEQEGRMGKSVALSSDGKILAIGASGSDANGVVDSGQVKVYMWDAEGSSWKQRGQNILGAAGDQSGFSVDISADGNTLAIGAPFHDGNGYRSGCMRLYLWDEMNLTYVNLPEDLVGIASGDEFGYSVSLSSDGMTVAVGADENDDAGIDSGQVKVFMQI